MTSDDVLTYVQSLPIELLRGIVMGNLMENYGTDWDTMMHALKDYEKLAKEVFGDSL